jgi:hypothetical protein
MAATARHGFSAIDGLLFFSRFGSSTLAVVAAFRELNPRQPPKRPSRKEGTMLLRQLQL